MRADARRRRAIIRVRRRLGWDTGTHRTLCGCVDCNATYGTVHAPLCRCYECTGFVILGPVTGYELYLMSKYANPQGS